MFAVNPANVILNSTTIKSASAGISVGSQIVAADATDDLHVDSTEILAEPTGATPVSHTAANRATNLISSYSAFSGSGPACLVAAMLQD